ncbi:hypothetical protein CPB86DRAFT_418189 [Serendipita vermifera]|nr:hypothetical protein CPB86DRAFT_418189 [Serendipita vermifera]
MRLASWITFPERLLASVFRPEDQQQQHGDDDEPSSPASLSLSSSFESGSSHGSTSSKSYMDAKPIKRKAIWERGTSEYVPSPVPQAWRDQVIDLAQEHMVCNDCHDILQGRDTSTDKFYEQKAMMVQREEIAWALWLQGLDKWDTVLRKHGLTLRANPAQRKEDRKAAAFSARRGSNVSSATAVSTDSSSSSDSGSTKVDASVDFAGRPIHVNLYAWPTAPASIRFTSKALEPAPKPAPRPKPTPSIFGTHNAHPMYLQTASRPSSSRQSSLLTLSDVQQREQQHEEEEKMEEDRQKRYTVALQEFLCDAYAMGDICDEFQRVIYYDLPEEPNWHQKITDDIWRWGMDRLSSWRGDSYGGW